jgi:mono/diheme cytochrome c family protein
MPQRPRRLFSRALVLGLLAVACGREEAAAPPAAAVPAAAPAAPAPAAGAVSAASRKEAEQVFATRCFTCHGVSGAGNGPASAGLVPQPRNLMDPEWQKSVTDAHIEQIILYGGAAVGKSPAMPGNPDLASKPEVVIALREYVRGLAQ